MSKDTVILDVDGCLLNWEEGFHKWITERGYRLLNPNEYCIENRYNLDTKKAGDLVKYFNESVYAGDLNPYPKAHKYLKKMQAKGWRLVVVTCFGSEPLVMESRLRNLAKAYPGVKFEKVHFLRPIDSKLEILKSYSDRAFIGIDDNFGHYMSLEKSGLFGCLLDHGYYNTTTINNITKVKTWKEFYEKAKEQYELSNRVHKQNTAAANDFVYSS